MKNQILILLVLSLVGAASFAQVDTNTGPIAPAPVTAEAKPAATWSELLQSKYNLTEAEVKSLNDAKISQPQQAMAARLARSSGKTIDEVLKMRIEDKMGWGKIAKTLGVAPGELGKAVSEMNKEQNAARKAAQEEKNRVKKEKRDAEKKARDEAKAAKRDEKRKDNDSRLRPNDKAKPEADERGKNK